MNATTEQAYDATDLAEMTEEGLYLNDKAFASHLPTISAVWTGEDYLVRHRKLGLKYGPLLVKLYKLMKEEPEAVRVIKMVNGQKFALKVSEL